MIFAPGVSFIHRIQNKLVTIALIISNILRTEK